MCIYWSKLQESTETDAKFSKTGAMKKKKKLEQWVKIRENLRVVKTKYPEIWPLFNQYEGYQIFLYFMKSVSYYKCSKMKKHFQRAYSSASTRCLNKKYTNSQQSKFLTMLTQITKLKINEVIQLKSYPEPSTNSQWRETAVC